MKKRKSSVDTVDPKTLQVFVAACHKVAEYGLIRCSSGNLSWRIGNNRALLSASRSWLGELDASQVAICELNSEQCINGKTPTVETRFHLGILKQRPEMNVVLHFQSPYATAIACGDPQQYNYNVIIEVPVYVGEPAVIDYCMPGTEPLAQKVIEAMRDHDMAILRNHGLVTCGRDFNDAIQKAVFFELACQILLTGNKIQPLGPDAIPPLRAAGKG
ncbi:MAG: class II aldolase/adducin family protein [Phycisphaerae bacterium]|nr:class II aldolase/adducin family protein [Phycisphaerae bacterium]